MTVFPSLAAENIAAVYPTVQHFGMAKVDAGNGVFIGFRIALADHIFRNGNVQQRLLGFRTIADGVAHRRYGRARHALTFNRQQIMAVFIQGKRADTEQTCCLAGQVFHAVDGERLNAEH